ncbi:MAG TPA: hypothetical protein VGI75_16600 [Pirellulales bacterium]|jgi:hypothetical protein
MPAQSEVDAGFYALVQEMLDAERKSYRGDRRLQTRQLFECQLLIAPYVDSRMPTGPEFHVVQCRNLSVSGMSYFADEPPEHPRLLVLLGAAPFTVVIAEVVHQTLPTNSFNGKHLIGCRFNGRLDQTA